MPSNEVRTMLEKPKRTKDTSFPFDPVGALTDVISALGHDPSLISTQDLQLIATRLSSIAKHEPAWGWRYLRNVLNRKIDASRKLVDAVMRLGAMIDSTPEDLATSQRVTIQASGKVRPGALVLADSVPCANPGCRIEFVPRTPNQKCHSAACYQIYRKVRRGK